MRSSVARAKFFGSSGSTKRTSIPWSLRVLAGRSRCRRRGRRGDDVVAGPGALPTSEGRGRLTAASASAATPPSSAAPRFSEDVCRSVHDAAVARCLAPAPQVRRARLETDTRPKIGTPSRRLAWVGRQRGKRAALQAGETSFLPEGSGSRSGVSEPSGRRDGRGALPCETDHLCPLQQREAPEGEPREAEDGRLVLGPDGRNTRPLSMDADNV